MAPSDRSPNDPGQGSEDLAIVQALRTTADLAARRRDDDPAWPQLETEIHALLGRLGIDGSVPPGSVGTGTIERAQLGPSRLDLLAALGALEREPTPDRARSALDQLATTGDADG